MPHLERIEIRVRGKNVNVSSVKIQDRTVICTGAWIRIASVHDEAYVEGGSVPDPASLLADLKRSGARPDIFTFMQHITDRDPRFDYPMEWENFAAIPITSYSDWLHNRARKDARENIRRATRDGVIVKACNYDDEFVSGIKRLYDETPLRQGKAFWHYGKSLEAIKEIHGTYCDRAEYIGAYFEGALIGFLKMVYTGRIAKTMHVFSSERYHRKRPSNALIAKAVEICEQRGMAFLIYGEYTFPGNIRNSLTEFKRNNGFEEIRYPRYFVPLTLKGRIAVRTGLYREIRTFLPKPLRRVLTNIRSNVHRLSQFRGRHPSPAGG